MASSLALRRAAASALLNPIRSVSVASSVFRSFSTDSQMTTVDGGDRSVDIDRLPDRSVARRADSFPSFFPGITDVFDPFSPTRSLSQVLNLMDQFLENPFSSASRGLGAGTTSRGFDVKEDNEALYIRMDMPGVPKENLKVYVDQNTLVIKGEAEKESEEEQARRYVSRLDLPPNLYKFDQIKAELKNGVLKIRIPKVKDEERKQNVVEVPVE